MTIRPSKKWPSAVFVAVSAGNTQASTMLAAEMAGADTNAEVSVAPAPKSIVVELVVAT